VIYDGVFHDVLLTFRFSTKLVIINKLKTEVKTAKFKKFGSTKNINLSEFRIYLENALGSFQTFLISLIPSLIPDKQEVLKIFQKQV
jgi:hypothetical protein